MCSQRLHAMFVDCHKFLSVYVTHNEGDEMVALQVSERLQCTDDARQLQGIDGQSCVVLSHMLFAIH